MGWGEGGKESGKFNCEASWCEAESYAESQAPESTSWAEIKSQMLQWMSQPGSPPVNWTLKVVQGPSTEWSEKTPVKCLKLHKDKTLKRGVLLGKWCFLLFSSQSVWLLNLKIRPQAQCLGFHLVEHDPWDNWSMITKHHHIILCDNGIWRTVRRLQFLLVRANFHLRMWREQGRCFPRLLQ